MQELIYKGVRIRHWTTGGAQYMNLFNGQVIYCETLQSAKNQITRILKGR